MAKSKSSKKKFNLANAIDQTRIGPNVKEIDIKKTCDEVKKYGFRGICVNPQWVRTAKMELRDTGSKVICLIDDPIGDSVHTLRVQACKTAQEDGADELDVVVSMPNVKHELWVDIFNDLSEISAIMPTKAIIGSGYLTDEEIAKVSAIVKKAGAICVKTATAKDPLEHRELKEKQFHLKIMKKAAPGLLLKASGNIKTAKDARDAIKAGADIIGTSSGVEIVGKKK
ncbi:MAG: deoxyribose-phosphate aldolase [Candidatus Nealsonbacteria bacterium]|nr:deoxyribose-phosphate aldolase [Candidatus Nealsonbacteria bacterium]